MGLKMQQCAVSILVICLYSAVVMSSKYDWDYMVFTQQWPPSVCEGSRLSHTHVCRVPANVTTWTIHGIWPTKLGTKGPSFCNRSAVYDKHVIDPIRGELSKFWANLYTDEPVDQFWSHEWTKHGTCAASQADMGSELKYFTKALQLNQEFNLLELYRKYQIVPKSAFTYQLYDLVRVLDKGLGKKVYLQCYEDKENKVQYLAQIEICLDKKFQPIDCETHSETHSVELREANRDSRSIVNSVMLQQCNDVTPVVYPAMHG